MSPGPDWKFDEEEHAADELRRITLAVRRVRQQLEAMTRTNVIFSHAKVLAGNLSDHLAILCHGLSVNVAEPPSYSAGELAEIADTFDPAFTLTPLEN